MIGCEETFWIVSDGEKVEISDHDPACMCRFALNPFFNLSGLLLKGSDEFIPAAFGCQFATDVRPPFSRLIKIT